ncbi:MAG TPA: sialidase family protein [Acidimicrobiales bacterium]|nr:sialidase family protein [Acidimicrobiales bacterium]
MLSRECGDIALGAHDGIVAGWRSWRARARRVPVLAGTLLLVPALLTPAAARASGPAFTPAVRIITNCGQSIPQCPEPTITVDESGDLYAMSYSAQDIVVVHDGDLEHVEHRAGPAPGYPIFGDAIIESDREGRLFVAGLKYPVGVGVFSSSDHGRSWKESVVATLPGADRPWLAFGPSGRVHLLYKDGAAEVVQTSTDHGATFGPPTLVAPPGRTVSFAGPAIVDGRGRLLFAMLTGAADFSSAPDLRLAVSADGGRTFTFSTIATQTSRYPLISWFPMLALGDDGVVRVAWNTAVGTDRSDMVVASSRDGGATWSAPLSWSGADTLTSAPGIASVGGALDVLWYRVTAPGLTSSLVFSRGAPDGTSTQRTVVADGIVARPARPAPTNEANTDFGDFALLPDGRAAVVWSDNGVWMAIEEPPNAADHGRHAGADAETDRLRPDPRIAPPPGSRDVAPARRGRLPVRSSRRWHGSSSRSTRPPCRSSGPICCRARTPIRTHGVRGVVNVRRQTAKTCRARRAGQAATAREVRLVRAFSIARMRRP